MAAGMLACGAVFAQAPSRKSAEPTDKDRKEDVRRHRVMAAAHENAAKCIESGKSEKECHERLRSDCKAVGVGKYCGMRHQH
jgi:hypothetical protein